ncbi:MAG TPA: OmpH family outer membrane protein, partial [Burkholderiales bacterium]|nr:OmpH family outer membrane protein [Burkholderiales bacterium]
SAREQEVRGMEAKVKALQAQLPGIAQPRERELKEREFQTQAQRLEQVGRAFVDDVDRRKAEERRKYFVEVTAIVNKIAEAQKLDLVVQEAVFAGKAVDITEQVVKAMGGPAPKPAGK